MKKIKIHVRNTVRGHDWYEDYEIANSKDAQQFAMDLVRRFNETLRPGEAPREVLGVEVVGEDGKEPPKKHDWEKVSLMTEGGGEERLHDKYRCQGCGITGKRYGLEENVVRDPEYRAKVYQDCTTARKRLEGKVERKRRKAEETVIHFGKGNDDEE